MAQTERMRSILIADDDRITRMILRKAFSADYEILEADDGDKALEILKGRSDVAAVLLDLQMPNTDGFGVLKAMQSRDELRNIPVIVVTASSDDESQTRALDAGAFDIIFKPVNPKVALHRVKSIVNRWEGHIVVRQNELLAKRLLESETDAKTGLYTQQAFCGNVERRLMEDPSVKCIILRFDIDNFKLYNDAFGISQGDRLLARIGECCRKFDREVYSALNAGKAVYGHFEADHFVVLMERAAYSEDVALELLKRLEELRDAEFELVVRIGVYEVENPSLPVALMCDRALMALKSIKADYSARIAYYNDKMRLSLIEEQQIVNEMAGALESGQFVVYLQPQYNQDDLSLHGAEALVRWKHPEKGIIPPNKFIPVFERNGFISRLDRYMLESVCRLMRGWLDRGMNVVPLSVNVSRRDIYNTDLFSAIVNTLKKYHIEPELIHLEITESAYMENPRQLIDVVGKLRQAGFVIEMDDFGSGYSSLNTLKDVPVDILKLDKDFMTVSMEDQRGGSILSSVVRMAHLLNLHVVAEGVETKVQAEYLKSVGCVYIQGFYFDQPLTVPEFENRLITRRPDLSRNFSVLEEIEGAADFLSATTQSALLFNSFVGGAGIVEYDGKNLEGLRFNDKFFEEMGVSRRDYANTTLNMRERFDDENWQKLVSAIEQAIDTRDESETEVQSKPLQSHDSPVWTKTRLRFLVKNKSRYILYMSVENIDEQVKVLQKNTKLSEQLTTIMDSVPGGICDFEVRDGNFKITFANEMLGRMFGYTRAEYMELFADNPYDAIYPPDRETQIPKAKAAFGDGREYVFDSYRHVVKDGSFKWIRLSAKLIHYEDGVCYGSGIIMDIDSEMSVKMRAQRQAEQLERNHIALKSLYDTIPCGIMEFTIRNHEIKLEGFNFAACRIFGYESRDEFVSAVRGKNLLMHTHPDDMKTVESSIRAAAKNSAYRLTSLEHRIIRVDGGIRWLRLLVQKTTYGEKDSILQCVFLDITDRKAAEKQMENALPMDVSPAVVAAPSGENHDLANYKAAFELMGIAGFGMNFKTGDFICSKAYEKYAMSSLSPKDVVGNSAGMRFVCPDDMDKIGEFFACASVSDYAETVLRLKMTDGSFRYTRIIGCFTRGEGGNILFAVGTLIDVDEAVRSKQSLKELSDRMKHIVDNIPSGIAIYDMRRDGLYPVYISDNVCKMFGFTREEYDLRIINGEKLGFSPEGFNLAREDVQKLMNGDSIVLPRLRVEKSDKSPLWITAHAHGVKQLGGALLVYTVLSDITDSVNAETLVEEKEREISAILDAVPGGIFKYSAETDEFSYISQTLLEMLGYTREEFDRKFHNRFSEIIWREDRDKTIDKINSDIAQFGDSDSCEYRIETKSGHLKWVYDAGRLITDANGKKWYIVAIIDHDEKMQYESRLTSLNEQISALIKNSPGGAASYRVNRNKWTVEYVSNGYLEMLGYSKDEFIAISDENVLALIHPGDREKAANEVAKINRDAASFSGQYRMRKKNGDYIWITANGNFVGTAGSGVYYMSYMDISDIKRMEEQLADDKLDMETIVNSIPGGIATYEVHPDFFQLLYASKGVAEVTGRTQDEYMNLINVQRSTDVYPADQKTVVGEIRRALEMDGELDINYRVTNLKGEILWINLRGRKTGEHNGNPVFLAVYHNITSEMILGERIDNVVRNIPGGLAVFSATDGIVKRTYLSDTARKILGYARDETPENDITGGLGRVHPDDVAGLRKAIGLAVDRKIEFRYDFRVIGWDQNVRWVDLIANPVISSDGSLSFYGIYTDITSQKRAEDFADKRRGEQLDRYRREINNLSAVQSDNLISKVYLDLTSRETISCWADEKKSPPMRGTDYDAVISETVSSAINQNDKTRIAQSFDCDAMLRLLEDKDASEVSVEYQRLNLAGRVCWVETTARAFRDPGSGHVMAFLFTYDIDDKRMPATLVERLMTRDAELLGLINVKTGVMHVYVSTQIDDGLSRGDDADYNSSYIQFVECCIEPKKRDEAMLALSLDSIVEGLSDAGESYRCQFWIEKDGKRAHKSWIFSYLDDGKTSVVILRTDTTGAYLTAERNRRALQKALHDAECAMHDGVTGLYNHAATIREINRRLFDASVDRYALLMIDLDDFKSINDNFGHPEGDRVLAEIAKTLKCHFRDSDVIGRVGGDEFMAFLPGVKTNESLNGSLNRLLSKINGIAVGTKGKLRAGCCIGGMLGSHGEYSLDEIYRRADEALYRAKHDGKNRFCFYNDAMTEKGENE